MVKSLFFVFAVVFLLSNMILVYKVPYRISFVKCAVVCFITEICFGALIAQCCSIVNIFIDLYSVGIGYLFIGVVLFVYNLRNRKIQQLYLNRIDMYSVITICVWFGIIFLKVFTPEILLTYRNVDPANHYIWAMNVVNEGTISTMFFAELYNGLFIEILQPILTEISLYKAFILADTFANLLNVFMFYCVGSHFCKKMFSKKILPFICLGYFLGWPFYNYAIGGFVYFGWGVTLFAYIVYLIIQLKYTKDEKQSFIVWLLIIIGCYCVLVCYIYFVPIIGMIVLCELFRTIRKNGIQLDWKVKGSIAIFILCAGAIAFCVVYFGFFEGDVLYVFNALKAHGGIQNELYKDFVFLMPIVIYMFWQRFKNQELDTIYNVIGIILFWIFVTFVLCLNEFISPYYYYKSYYLF